MVSGSKVSFIINNRITIVLNKGVCAATTSQKVGTSTACNRVISSTSSKEYLPERYQLMFDQ